MGSFVTGFYAQAASSNPAATALGHRFRVMYASPNSFPPRNDGPVVTGGL